MKNFESFMAQNLEQYVTYRQQLGYSMKSIQSRLSAFDRYLKQQNTHRDLMHPSFFLQLRANIAKNPSTVNGILSELRSFFKFLVRRDIYAHNPLQDIPSLPKTHFVPFVFSPEQIDQLLTTVCKRLRKTKYSYLKDLSQYMAILLMARCGLRISEPLRMMRHHYRQKEKTLYIEKTKFKKDRLIPVSMAVATEMENYLAVRNSLLRNDHNPYFLAGFKQKTLNQNTLRLGFHRAVKDIGLNRVKQTAGNITFGAPVPHSLRHSFAINTLKQIKDRGESRQHALPVLATYMGHRKYQSTSAYLKVSDAKDVSGLIEFAKSQQVVT
ncbi:MAG: tyrosine-type recombinase/integrase [Deltaproteobacteria bacterium]|nr:tyrosine-type recombinase/integrase [Deltaproteobacteria bacterium]